MDRVKRLDGLIKEMEKLQREFKIEEQKIQRACIHDYRFGFPPECVKCGRFQPSKMDQILEEQERRHWAVPNWWD